jgi:site-specific DNA recombinase
MTSYNTPNRTAGSSRGTHPMTTIPDADLTAIYCRKAKKGDKQQITTNRQKRLAIDDCGKLGLTVNPQNIFIDNGASAWQRNRKRPGWDELIKAAKRGEIKHIVCYHPDRLMRQPFDLEELLTISDEFGITLYGRVNARNLQDPDDRYALRIEIAHACRSSDDTSRRLKDQKQERAEAGYYNGTRPYGYTKNGMKIAPEEAEIVREIFARFTKGEKPYAISADLNRRGITTAKGAAWTEASIRRPLQSKHVAGILVHRGQEIGVGKWPAIITRAQWDFAQEMLAFRSSAARGEQAKRKAPRSYILRGLVVCGNCGTAMAGCSGTVYRCSRANRQDGQKCARTMQAEPLEEFVEDAAIRLLEILAVGPKRPRTAAAETAEREIEEDERQLAELHDMWIKKEIDSAEYRRDRRIIQARIRDNQKKTIVKVKSPDAIADLIGPDAKAKWARLTDERKNSVLRFLFSAVIIGPGTMNRYPSVIDFGRIEIEENEIA